MQYQKYFISLFIIILLTGLLSYTVYLADQHYQATYNPFFSLGLINLSYIILGLIPGIIYLPRQYKIPGKWKINRYQLTIITLPLLILYLAMIFNIGGIFTNYHTFINTFFKDATGILIGYSFISSFYK